VAAMDDVQMRIEPPTAGTEAELLLASLDRQRAIFAWKTGGLDAAGLRATTAASTMTLGGLIKHLALVEDDMFSQKLLGQPAAPPNLRRMVVDMIEEYARHIGHADLLRESVDGLVGEDPPR
jgi:CHASE2 domain-containing sensor protein